MIFTGTFPKIVDDSDQLQAEVGGIKLVARTVRDDIQDMDDNCGYAPSRDPHDDGYVGEVSDAEFEEMRQLAKKQREDFEEGLWDYCGVVVQAYVGDLPVTKEYEFAVWGIERNMPGTTNDYLVEVANELAEEALAAAQKRIQVLAY